MTLPSERLEKDFFMHCPKCKSGDTAKTEGSYEWHCFECSHYWYETDYCPKCRVGELKIYSKPDGNYITCTCCPWTEKCNMVTLQ